MTYRMPSNTHSMLKCTFKTDVLGYGCASLYVISFSFELFNSIGSCMVNFHCFMVLLNQFLASYSTIQKLYSMVARKDIGKP